MEVLNGNVPLWDSTNRVRRMKLQPCLGIGFHHQKAVGSLVMGGKQMVGNKEASGQTVSVVTASPRASAGRTGTC